MRTTQDYDIFGIILSNLIACGAIFTQDNQFILWTFPSLWKDGLSWASLMFLIHCHVVNLSIKIQDSIKSITYALTLSGLLTHVFKIEFEISLRNRGVRINRVQGMWDSN